MLLEKLKNMKEWLPVIVLSFAVFVFGTSEMVPIGLLPNIAQSLGRSEADTGLLLTIYAWVVAIVSLPLTIATANVERKKLILIILTIFMIGNFCVALSNQFETIMASRVVVAFGHAVFWSIIPPLAFRISPAGKSSYGLAIIGGGFTASTVLGIPLCTAIGQKFGWNFAFHVISIVSLLIIMILYFSLPKISPIKTNKNIAFYRLRKNKSLMVAFLITILLVTSHLSVFTYIVPFLRNVSNFSENSVVILLLLYGFVGAIGISFAGKFMDKHMRKIMIYTVIIVCILMLSMRFVSPYKPYIIILLLSWGICLSTLFPTLQGWTIKLSKKDSDMASSIYSTMFNIGIGSGALIGGQFMTNFGITNQGFCGTIIMLPVIALMMIYARKVKRKKTVTTAPSHVTPGKRVKGSR